MKVFLKIAVATSMLVAGIAGAYAAKSNDNDAVATTLPKTTLSQAIAVAEQHSNGKAVRAEYEQHKGNWVYDIEVVNGAKTFDVKVDPDKAVVLSATEDKVDHDDGEDKDD